MDRDYREHRKVFQDDPKGAAENGLKKARAFIAKIEKKSDTDEHGTIRGKVSLKVEESMDDMRGILESIKVNAILREAAEDSKCGAQYMDAGTGRFKGGKGERFDNCVSYMKCKGGVDDPEALCAKIARAKGAAPGGASEAIGEAVAAAMLDRIADAMLSAPRLEVLLGRVLDADQQDLFDGMIAGPLAALIGKALDAAGAQVAGGAMAHANREMRGAARGELGA